MDHNQSQCTLLAHIQGEFEEEYQPEKSRINITHQERRRSSENKRYANLGGPDQDEIIDRKVI